MKYIVFLLAFFIPVLAFAEDSNTIRYIPDDISQDEIDANLPKCDDLSLVESVVEEINKYMDEQTDGSIIDKRKRNLVLNYINSYTEENVENFEPQRNYLVADTIIKLKINNHVRGENMRLCVSGGKKPVYLLVYPEDFRYNVEVINLPAKRGNLTFLYTPPLKKYESFEE
ncbi:MAG: hypothetical protein J6T72_00135 [Alphaproteobacteria bacterium]|nr:hypothetical protein [Alphaproteobacteria bacterium]